MSAFSAVDSAPDPDRLIAYLDQVGLTAMRHYMAATHARRASTSPVLDLGCGSGRDLSVLHGLGVPTVGVDPSTHMIDATASRVRIPLVRATGEDLPFVDGAFAGCSIQRVLMHVDDPATVVAEVVRCVQPNGVVTIFEPDWSSLAVNAAPLPIRWISIAKHPSVGGIVGDLLRAAGCVVRDRVEERSWWTFGELERITNLEASLDRAVAAGDATRPEVDGWLAEKRRRNAPDDVAAEMVKLLWVATTPGG